jgi:hypothetical protein
MGNASVLPCLRISIEITVKWMKTNKTTLFPILIGMIIFASIVVPTCAGSNGGGIGYHIRNLVVDPSGETYNEWIWPTDKYEDELWEYYRIVHTLTGWNVPLLDYIQEVSPGDLATMPPEMYEYFQYQDEPVFGDGCGVFPDGDKDWLRVHQFHFWISPDGYVYNGDRPPYQWLLWKGWEEYADQLPAAPDGAPFPAPFYGGTPRNTLPFTKMDTTGFYNGNYPIENPCPNAVVSPGDLSEWDWTGEIKAHLMNLGLDPDMGNTRLGYEISGTTITVVGMTPSGVMKEWTLTRLKGEWTCDSADAEELEDILFILMKIDAITDTSIQVSVPTGAREAFVDR